MHIATDRCYGRHSFCAVISAALMCLAIADTTQAERANHQEMKQVAENYLTEIVAVTGNWAGVDKPSIIAGHDLYSGDTLVAVYYDISPNGFVLVPAFKEMVPIKAYSDDCNLGKADDDSLLCLLRDELSRRFSLYVSVYGSLDTQQPKSGEAVFGQSQRLLWDRYSVTSDEFKMNLSERGFADFRDAGPLLTSSWSQGAPYNDSVPNGYGGRCVVGCTATAAAMILDFWQWPLQGFGSESYEWDGDNSCAGGTTEGRTLTAYFSDPYDWANMADSCDGGCTAAQRAALAELSHDVGVAYHEDYGRCGSAADPTHGLKMLPYHFQYNPGLKFEQRIDYSLKDWFFAIKEEIDNGRPAHYSINSHLIVCDGYREVSGAYQYHMNYGWGGSSTAWYTLDSLYCSWQPNNHCPAEEDFMICNLYPQTEPWLELMGYTYDDGDHDRRIEAGEQVQLRVTALNRGADATNVVANVVTEDAYVTVNDGSSNLGTAIAWNGQATGLDDMVITISPSCPNPHIASLAVTVSADGGFATMDTIRILVGDVSGFSDDMESGEGDWSRARLTTGYKDEWHMGSQQVHSGVASWKAGGSGADVYSAADGSALITPPILLPANAKLSFWHWIDAELDATPGLAFDGADVAISSGDGNWTQIEPVGGYPDVITVLSACPFDPGTKCFSGTHDWTQAEFDLSAYSGIVYIAFRWGTDGALCKEGWYIDDVSIVGGSCCSDPTRGNLDGSSDGLVGMGDLTVLIDHLFITLTPLSCPEAGNLDLSADNLVGMGDLTVLIDNLFITLNPLPACP